MLASRCCSDSVFLLGHCFSDPILRQKSNNITKNCPIAGMSNMRPSTGFFAARSCLRDLKKKMNLKSFEMKFKKKKKN